LVENEFRLCPMTIFLRLVQIYKYCLQTMLAHSLQTSFVLVLSVFVNSPQTNIRCSLFPVVNGKQDTMFAIVEVFLNTSSVYRELQTRQALRMWTSENTVKLDNICSNTSKSVGVILTIFLKPSPSSTFKSAKRFSPFAPSLRKSTNVYIVAFQFTEIYIHRRFHPHDMIILNWLISGRETMYADSPQT
jgi:hypothetical protein